MNNWFECKVSYKKMQENGMYKKVTEAYLVDALSFTEAEARIIEEIRPFITGDFMVTDIKRAKFAESFLKDDAGDRYFKVKIFFITLDEKSGAEKKTPYQRLVQGDDIEEDKSIFCNEMKNTLSDFRIDSIAETKLVNVFPFDPHKNV